MSVDWDMWRQYQHVTDLFTCSHVLVVGAMWLDVVFAAVRTHDRIADLVHGAQVEDVHLLLFEYLVAEVAEELVENELIK